MTREIQHAPMPAVEYEQHGDHDTVDLHCSICDVRLHAEGEQLGGLAEAIDDAHALRHRQEDRA